jgi:LacI family transcriptional regulator
MAKKPPLRIALLLSQDIGYCRAVLAGILSYRSTRSSWIHRDSPPDIRIMPALKSWNPDGIIGHIFDPKISAALEKFSCPIVNTTSTIKNYEIPRIDVNNLKTGEMAAHYFQNKGFTDYAYFGSSWAQFSLHREKGFKQVVESQGHNVSVCHAEFLPRPPFKSTWDNRDKRVVDWLTSLPKPCAIMASNDIPARYLTELCSELDIQIPRDLAILGVDNDEAECRMSTPSLTSIETPAKGIGFQAAKMLDELLAGKQLEEKHMSMDPLRVVSRDSTDIERHLDPTIQKLIDIITQSATENPSVEDIAQQCGISRRLLEKKVTTLLNSTILTLIQEQQIKIAKNLLLDSHLSIGAIAEMSGMGNQRRLNDVFRKRTQTSPSQFRKSQLNTAP